MTKDENIQYLTLRGEECRLPAEDMEKIKEKLVNLSEEDYEHLKRISEPAFRSWCTDVCSN